MFKLFAINLYIFTSYKSSYFLINLQQLKKRSNVLFCMKLMIVHVLHTTEWISAQMNAYLKGLEWCLLIFSHLFASR